MTVQTLRELAREYAKGTLDRESYRRNRAALIDGILSGTIAVPPIDYAPPVAGKSTLDTTHPGKRRKKEAAEAEIEDLDFFDITQVVTPADVTPPRPAPQVREEEQDDEPAKPVRTFPMPAIIGVIILVAIAILGYVLFSGAGDEEVAPTAPRTTASAPVTEPAPELPATAPDAGGVAADAIIEFLRMKNWSDEALVQFVTSWNALPRSDREAAAGSGEMLQLANAIYRRSLEVRALSQVTGDETAIARQDRLLEFARTLGINDPRLAPAAAPAAE